MVGVAVDGMGFHTVTTTNVLKISLAGVEGAIPILFLF